MNPDSARTARRLTKTARFWAMDEMKAKYGILREIQKEHREGEKRMSGGTSRSRTSR